MNVLSPRVFEAASLGTAMVMFPGEYSGVTTAGEHYIVLEKDFSNMDSVVAQIRDDDVVAAVAKRAYEHLIGSGRWSYRSFIAEFDRVIDEEAPSKRGPASAPRWRIARAERTIRVPGLRVRFFSTAHRVWTRAFGRDPTMRFTIEYESQVKKAFFALGIVLREADLRSLLQLGRRDGAPLDRLLREIMELALLRRAARGGLKPGQEFTLRPEYDLDRRALCFVSTPSGHNGDAHAVTVDPILDAMREGRLEVLEWDHRAMGGKIQLERPSMVVGIGFEGLENFTVLARIGRENPSALERALAPALLRGGARPATNSVG